MKRNRDQPPVLAFPLVAYHHAEAGQLAAQVAGVAAPVGVERPLPGTQQRVGTYNRALRLLTEKRIVEVATPLSWTAYGR